MNNRLMVYVRAKPLADERSIIDIVDDRTLIFDPIDPDDDQDDLHSFHERQLNVIGQRRRRRKNSSYMFDGVFNDGSTNWSIFETVTRPMVDATIDGYNCSVFAYGATGSGKTHTMLGEPKIPGVIYYTTKDLFEKLSLISEKDPLPAQLKICYFEIYNEKIRDLLVFEPNNFIRCGSRRLRTSSERTPVRSKGVARDGCNLPVCEAPGSGHSLVIPDLTYHTPENAEQLIELIEAGNANRSQHPTDANADSSRSHAIFQIVLTRRTRRLNDNQPGAEYELQNSKMSLIDLAGSERASLAYRLGNDRGENIQREGAYINKSLLALGNCIDSLASKSAHIPYRNSKLTRLLRDSLGGNCLTAMISAISQQQTHYDDTQNTLLYASRAKRIQLKATRNVTSVAIQLRQYKTIIEDQTKQIASLQAEIQQLKAQFSDSTPLSANERPASPPLETEYEASQETPEEPVSPARSSQASESQKEPGPDYSLGRLQVSRLSCCQQEGSAAEPIFEVYTSDPARPNEYLRPIIFEQNTIGKGRILTDKKQEFYGCPGDTLESNRVLEITQHQTARSFVLWVTFENFRGWVSFEVVQRLEPKHVLVDYLRCLFLFHRDRWRGVKRKFETSLPAYSLSDYISDDIRNLRNDFVKRRKRKARLRYYLRKKSRG